MKTRKITNTERERLVETADLAKINAYAPYSQYPVGAALLTEDYTFFAGCNVENSSYGLTICAERNAIFKAVSAGQRKFKAIAIVSKDDFLPPCGACRQVLSEFSPEIEIILSAPKGGIKVISLKKLFPMPVDLKKLRKKTSKRK